MSTQITPEQARETPPPAGSPSRRSLALVGIAFLVILGALLAAGYWPRAARARQAAQAAQAGERSLPAVTVAPVAEAPAEIEIRLPGTVQAEAETPIYARADGYLKRRLVDIGDRVEAGQLLAEIDSPELEEQIREAESTWKRSQSALRQAEAVLQQAQANLGLADVTAQRWRTLVSKGVVSKQDGDEKEAILAARKADVAAAEANVQAARDNVAASEAALKRLRALQAFRQVHAPFRGIITARNVEVGSLVSAGSSVSLREMFRLAQTDVVRVYVQTPQSEAPEIRRGLECRVEIKELPGRQFLGRVSRTADALDPLTRTLLTEVQTPNPDGALLPGMYATVRFVIRRRNAPLLIPSSAFRNTGTGPVVGVLTEGAVVRLVPVVLGRDYGAQIEVLSGLKAGQRVITSFSDEVRDGAKVRPVAPPKTASKTKQGGAAQ